MKISFIRPTVAPIVVGVALAVASFAAPAQDALETDQQKMSYMLGMEVGRSLKRTGMEIDLDAFVAAIKAMIEDETPLLSQDEAAELQSALMQKMQQKAQADSAAAGGENKMAGETFLAENKTKQGVMTTASGLQYKVIEEGEGNKPAETDTVSVHYKGTTIDGTEFDSSYSRGEPAEFALNGVISGWTEGLQLMTVGSKYQFFIPPELAYGERGAGEQIGPNSTLIFEVELLEIK